MVTCLKLGKVRGLASPSRGSSSPASRPPSWWSLTTSSP
uniref:Uncharacterized protein n=1 Tax=Arundo donax TaxID=35708 RepID=A0A0A8Y9I8_ARUDO